MLLDKKGIKCSIQTVIMMYKPFMRKTDEDIKMQTLFLFPNIRNMV